MCIASSCQRGIREHLETTIGRNGVWSLIGKIHTESMTRRWKALFRDCYQCRDFMIYSSRPYLPWATPVVSGHLPCMATLSMSRHLSTLNYLRSADTCLTRTRTVMYWLSVPATVDSVNKSHVVGGHFNPKSLARTLTCDRNFAQISVLSSVDHKQYLISMPA